MAHILAHLQQLSRTSCHTYSNYGAHPGTPTVTIWHTSCHTYSNFCAPHVTPTVTRYVRIRGRPFSNSKALPVTMNPPLSPYCHQKDFKNVNGRNMSVYIWKSRSLIMSSGWLKVNKYWHRWYPLVRVSGRWWQYGVTVGDSRWHLVTRGDIGITLSAVEKHWEQLVTLW